MINEKHYKLSLITHICWDHFDVLLFRFQEAHERTVKVAATLTRQVVHIIRTI